MNTTPQQETETQIRLNMIEAAGLVRSGQPEHAIELLSEMAGNMACLDDADKFGSVLARIERLLIFLQRRRISASEHQVAVRLGAIAEISPAMKIIVHAPDMNLSQTGTDLERIYGQHGTHALLLDLSDTPTVDAKGQQFLLATSAKWRARGCFLGMICARPPRALPIPVFCSVDEARAYLHVSSGGETGEGETNVHGL